MRTILLIVIVLVVLGVIASVLASRPRTKKLTSAEKIELNAARDLIANLHRSASEVSNEQPFGFIVLDEINSHNRKVRELG